MSVVFGRTGLFLLAAAVFSFSAAPGVATAAGLETTPAEVDETAPSPKLGPEDVVRIQLQALRGNDETNQGIAIAFRFASPRNKASTGPLPRFIHMIKAGPYKLMLEFERASYMPARIEGARAVQRVTLVGSREIRTYDFLLRRQTESPWERCWMTEAVIVVPGVEKPV